MTTGARRRRAVPLLQVLPAVLLTGFVALGGLVVLVAQSVGLLPVVGAPALTLAPFAAAGAELPRSVLASLGIAAASTLVALVVGLVAAVLVLRVAGPSRLIRWTSALTVPVPHLVGAVAVGLLLADGGVLPDLLGIAPARWPDLVGGPGGIATVLELGWKESAFVALVVVGSLGTRLRGYEETAAVLGAGPAARLRHVVLPLASPALLVSGCIVLVSAMGSYEVPWLLGRAYPEPLPVLAVRLYDSISLTSRPAAAAAAVITVALCGAAVAAALALVAVARRRR